MTVFTPFASTLGGMMVGASAALMLVFNGRIAGISGIVGQLLEGREGRSWRASFVVGMIVGGIVLQLVYPSALPGLGETPIALPLLIAAGLSVGIGTRLGGGCTSGHGICGLSRMSPRSLAATAIFMGVAGVTTFVLRHVLQVGAS